MSAFLPIRNEVHPDVYVVSTVYKFDCNIKHFDKPFTLHLQHCVKLQSSEDCYKMFFISQHGDRTDIKHGNFEIGNSYGTLKLNRFCIKYICWSRKRNHQGLLIHMIPLDDLNHHSSKSDSAKVASFQPSRNSSEIPLHNDQPSSSDHYYSSIESSVYINTNTSNKENKQKENEFLPWGYEWMLALPKNHSKLANWNGIYSVYINLAAWRTVSP